MDGDGDGDGDETSLQVIVCFINNALSNTDYLNFQYTMVLVM